MPDFTRLQSVATRLIRGSGRSVTMLRESRNPKDPEKPWDGNQCVDQDVEVVAVILDYEERDIDGERVRRGDKRALIEVPSTGEDLSSYDFLVDRGARWRIQNIERIEPSDVVVVYDAQLRR